MTDTNDWMEPGYEDQGTELVKDLRKQLREKASSEKELAEKLAKLENQLRTETVSKVLEGRGVPAKVAALIPSNVEATADGVGKWLDEYGDVFNIPKSEVQATETVVDKEQVEAMKTMQEVSHNAEPAKVGGPVTEKDLMDATDLEALRALIARGG